MTSKAFIIAEAGVNHNGDIANALKLIDVAAECGADAVKFQTFKASELATDAAHKADYQAARTGGESQLEMLKKLELTEAEFVQAAEHCRTRGVLFMSTPFDEASLDFLVAKTGMDRVKIPSGEIGNGPFMLAIARTGLPCILSSGMSTLSEVEAALGVLAFGYTAAKDAAPSLAAFERAYASEEGQAALRVKVVLLHCTTEYPAPVEQINLSVMATMQRAFGLPVGFSDHSVGIHLASAAVAMGAAMIEKHFTLSRAMEGPDHAASLEPGELKTMIANIRDVECATGDGIKRPTAAEWPNRGVARKSIVAARDIAEGEVLASGMLKFKRPGTGLSPMRYWELLGRKAGRAYRANELIDYGG
jgi:N-acetylneuraminate synthase